MSILATTADILNLMINLQRGIRVQDVMTHLSMPKSTASRVMSQLNALGYLEKQESGLFMPGPLLLATSQLANQQYSLGDLVDGALRGLCEQTGYTGYISILDNQEILVLRVIHGRHPLPVVTWPGSRSPAWGTSTGRALLARLSLQQLREFFATPLVQAQLQGAQQGEMALFSAVTRAKEEGYAWAINETVSDTAAVSCAVGDPASHEAVAFCLSFPQALATPAEIHRVSTLLKQTAMTIARKTGDSWMNDPIG